MTRRSEYFKHITKEKKDFYDRTWPMNFCINRNILFLGFDGIVKEDALLVLFYIMSFQGDVLTHRTSRNQIAREINWDKRKVSSCIQSLLDAELIREEFVFDDDNQKWSKFIPNIMMDWVNTKFVKKEIEIQEDEIDALGRAKTVQGGGTKTVPHIKKEEIYIKKKKETLAGLPSPFEFLKDQDIKSTIIAQIPIKIQNKIYAANGEDQAYYEEEFQKIEAYLQQPNRPVKNMGSFVTNWFCRAKKWKQQGQGLQEYANKIDKKTQEIPRQHPPVYVYKPEEEEVHVPSKEAIDDLKGLRESLERVHGVTQTMTTGLTMDAVKLKSKGLRGVFENTFGILGGAATANT